MSSGRITTSRTRSARTRSTTAAAIPRRWCCRSSNRRSPMVKRCAALLVASLVAATARAQTVKIGVVNTFSGPAASFGELGDKAMKLYMKLHANELGGVKLELVMRDDGGPNPDKAKQLAQELIVRDKVQILTGVVFTPTAAGRGPLPAEAKVPFVIMNAGGSAITTLSPYIARLSFTLWQSS